MAKSATTKPIMRPDQERYMAFEGLVQWTQAVVNQAERVKEARARQFSRDLDHSARRLAVLATHCEDHFFIVAANKLIEYRDWAMSSGLCSTVDFNEVDQFNLPDIRDLRNMREHIVEYFRGEGHTPSRWMVQTPAYNADASSVVGTMLGGRLDWVAFAAAAKRLLPALLAEPIPYASHP